MSNKKKDCTLNSPLSPYSSLLLKRGWGDLYKENYHSRNKNIPTPEFSIGGLDKKEIPFFILGSRLVLSDLW